MGISPATSYRAREERLLNLRDLGRGGGISKSDNNLRDRPEEGEGDTCETMDKLKIFLRIRHVLPIGHLYCLSPKKYFFEKVGHFSIKKSVKKMKLPFSIFFN